MPWGTIVRAVVVVDDDVGEVEDAGSVVALDGTGGSTLVVVVSLAPPVQAAKVRTTRRRIGRRVTGTEGYRRHEVVRPRPRSEAVVFAPRIGLGDGVP